MSKFTKFMKANKTLKEVTKYAPTKSLVDEDGKPLEFTLKPLTTKDNDAIRDACTREVPIPGKPNTYRSKIDTSLYVRKMLCACITEPNLYDKALQDSYGVMTPEDLIYEMIDDPGEYQNFAIHVQDINGFNDSFEDKVEKAKN